MSSAVLNQQSVFVCRYHFEDTVSWNFLPFSFNGFRRSVTESPPFGTACAIGSIFTTTCYQAVAAGVCSGIDGSCVTNQSRGVSVQFLTLVVRRMTRPFGENSTVIDAFR